MKKANLLLVNASFLVFALNAFAQENDEPQYLINLKEVKYSGFGNTITEFSKIDGDIGITQGGAGALLLNYTYFIGFYGTNIVTNHRVEDIYPDNHDPNINPLPPSYDDMQLAFEDNGLWLGYIKSYKNLIHWSADVRAGWGKISIYDKHIDFENVDKVLVDNVFAISPEVNLELNVARWFKIAIGGGYRLVTGFDDIIYTNYSGEKKTLYKSSQFNSPFMNVKFLFGSFARRSKHKSIEE